MEEILVFKVVLNMLKRVLRSVSHVAITVFIIGLVAWGLWCFVPGFSHYILIVWSYTKSFIGFITGVVTKIPQYLGGLKI